MSNHYHKRIFVMSFTDESLSKTWDLIKSKETTAEAIYAMVGRQVMYGLINAEPRQQDEIDLITGHLEERELTCGHYAPIPARGADVDGYIPYLGSKECQVDDTIAAIASTSKSKWRPFILGAVLHSDKTWGFHS